MPMLRLARRVSAVAEYLPRLRLGGVEREQRQEAACLVGVDGHRVGRSQVSTPPPGLIVPGHGRAVALATSPAMVVLSVLIVSMPTLRGYQTARPSRHRSRAVSSDFMLTLDACTCDKPCRTWTRWTQRNETYRITNAFQVDGTSTVCRAWTHWTSFWALHGMRAHAHLRTTPNGKNRGFAVFPQRLHAVAPFLPATKSVQCVQALTLS
jgi:hypothetical protein